MKKCPKCGYKQDDQIKKCHSCGYVFSEVENQVSKQEKRFSIREWTAWVGGLIIVIGIIAGFVLGIGNGYDPINWIVVLEISCVSIISGTLLLSLGKIIELLEIIAEK